MSLRESITMDDAIAFMNEAIAIDQEFVARLISARVECNRAIADHPTIQAGTGADGKYECGFLGVLNGLFGSRDEDHWGGICVVMDPDLRTPVRFERTPDRSKLLSG